VTTKPLDSHICPGSGTFPDIVNDLDLSELTYVCAGCGTRVPNSEAAPVHRHGLGEPRPRTAGSLPLRTATT
jgi:hypothetical protein